MKLKLYFILLFLISQSILAQNSYYWVGGPGNWTDLNHWRIGSSSGQAATIIPSRYDNVYITSGSGFTSSGGMLNIPSTATCKDFIIDDSFNTKLSFPPGSVFNVYGNLKWKSNAGAYYNLTMNMFSDSSNPTPNLIDVPDNMIDLLYVNGGYQSSFNLKGNGTFKLVRNFASNGFFLFNISDSAFLDTDHKNISSLMFTHSSTAASNFRSSMITAASTITFNSSANLTQATISAPMLNIQTTQDIKKILLTSSGYSQVSGGSLLTVDEVTGVGTSGGSFTGNQFNINTLNLYACIFNTPLLKANDIVIGDGSVEMTGTRFEVKNMTLGKGNNIFRASQFDINNLTLNGGQYNFRQPLGTSSTYFQVNQTLTANIPCNGVIPKFGGLDTSLPVNLILPGSINGNGIVSFNGYNMAITKLTGGASVTAGINGGNNTGNITYPGITAKTYYWIGGGGNWSDPAHWSFTSGGPSANCIPIMYDDVIFNEYSGFTAGSNNISNNSAIGSVRNMTWNNAPANPVLNVPMNVYGNIYLQKDMSAPVAMTLLKYNTGDPVVNRYMNFEGQKINQLSIFGNDNFYLMASGSGSAYDLEVGGVFNFDNNALTSNLYADGRKIKSGELWLGGNNVSIDNALLRQTILNILSKQTITAPNTAVYTQNYNGRYYNSGNTNNFFGKVYKEGNSVGDIQHMNTDFFQVNGGDIRLYGNNRAKNVTINSSSNITMFDTATKLTVTDSWIYNRTDCDLVVNFSGQGGSNIVVGNTINGNGFVELNRMNFSGINASYINPVAGAKPINASNSIDSGSNSGINFMATTPKNFYWKGGPGTWNDLSHWSLDATSARTTANCGLPTINDNVFFDQYSGFSTTGITSIQLSNDVSINDITFSGLTPGSRSHFSGNSNYYKININGNAVLHAGYYDAGYFSGFTFINSNKPAGTLKNVTPNGATSALNFAGDAQWKINRGTSQYDLTGNSSIGQTSITGNILDISGTVMNINVVNINGSQLLMDNADLTVTSGFTINTKQPVINTANSVIRLLRNYGGSDADVAFNNLNHYFEKIEYTNSSTNSDYIISFSFPGGIINNFIIHSATNSRIDKVNPSIALKTAMVVNNLTIEKNNYVALDGNLQVNQSLKILGDCLDRLTFASSNAQLKTLILPNYSTNPSNYVMDKVQFKAISSSGGQTYTATGSTDLGGNVGINFQDAIPSTPRNLYWIGGQGLWQDPQHWSLSSGGIPVAGCNIPTAVDNVFFDQNSGFTPTSNKIIIRGNNISKANNITFNNAPNQPVLDFGTSASTPYYLNVYGNLALQSDLKIIVPMSTYAFTRSIIMTQGTSTGKTRYIDTKGAYLYLNINSQDYFELKSPYQGDINFNNAAGFKTNDQPMNLVNFSWNQNINNNPVVDFGQSVITGTRTNSTGTANYYVAAISYYSFYSPYFYINSGNNPITLNTSATKADIGYFTTITPDAYAFGDLTIWKDGTVNTGSKVWNFNTMTFLGSSATNTVSTLTSAGKYKTLYFNPGSYQIDNNQTVTENLFMTGTPCNRISVIKSTAGQNTINLDPAATYTMFYASIRDMNFSRSVSAYGNSQDLGNTANLTIVPTNVQAAGFGGNKALCASEFPKTYDASALYGTDPNATYTWTKLNTPNSGVMSTSPLVTFTQPGNYRVNVTYSQDGCNITEDFTISSIALPADSTISSATSTMKQPSGDIPVKFKGSLAQNYTFTYSINGGPDQDITSAANGEAIILHSKAQTGTFIYRLKSIRFASGDACSTAINKDIIVNINPDCPTPGVMMLMDNVLRGCTSSTGARRLSELNPSVVSNPPTDAGVTRLISGTGIVVKEGNDVFMIRNANDTPEILTLPTNKPHIQGAIIYHNDHFYEGVENGKWIRVDND